MFPPCIRAATTENVLVTISRASLAACLAGSIALSTATPASAWYRGHYYRHYDPGPAIALGMFGAMAGAIIASQGGYPPYGYAPAYGYYPNSSYNPYAFGPAGCAAGFYWNGQECWPY
jgi:hypothetical protein